jgi:hypothetical protein
MSSVIRFLEQMGRSANLRHSTKPVLYKTLNELQVDQSAQWAILCGDQSTLEVLLGARTKLCCMLMVPHGNTVGDIERETRLLASPR